MKLSEAILLGSTLVKPVRGQIDDGNGGGCAYGMAKRSSNSTFANPAWGDWSEAEEYAKRVVKVIIDLIPASSGALDRAIAEAQQRVADEYEGVHKLIEDVRLLTVDSWPQTHSNPPDVEKWRTIVACLIKCDREVIRALESSAKGEGK